MTPGGNLALPNQVNGIGYGRNGTGSFETTLIDGNVISGNIGMGVVSAFGGTLTITRNLIGRTPRAKPQFRIRLMGSASAARESPQRVSLAAIPWTPAT